MFKDTLGELILNISISKNTKFSVYRKRHKYTDLKSVFLIYDSYKRYSSLLPPRRLEGFLRIVEKSNSVRKLL